MHVGENCILIVYGKVMENCLKVRTHIHTRLRVFSIGRNVSLFQLSFISFFLD